MDLRHLAPPLLAMAIAACGHPPSSTRSLLQNPDDLLLEAPDSGQIDVIGLTEPGADGKRDGHLVLTVGMPTGNTIRGIDLYVGSAAGHRDGTPWSSWQAPNYLLGVTWPGRPTMEAYPKTLGSFPPGRTTFDLYGEGYYDSFGHNKWFSADVLFEDGTVRTIDLKR